MLPITIGLFSFVVMIVWIAVIDSKKARRRKNFENNLKSFDDKRE